jgi:CDGSH-type Zn-finger protein
MSEQKIKGREDGPYLVPGQAKYLDAAGREQSTEGTMFALCRCGQSGNKPFCDGTHRKVEFKAPAVELTLAE